MTQTDETPAVDEYFMLWLMVTQTKDAILRARDRDYARFGISNDRRRPLRHREQRRQRHPGRDLPPSPS